MIRSNVEIPSMRMALQLAATVLLLARGSLSASEPTEPVSFKHAGVVEAWDKFGDRLTFGAGQTLALVDDGCDLSMPEWQPSGDRPKVLVSYDSVDGDDNPKHEGKGYHGSTIGVPSSLDYNGKRGVAHADQVAVIRALECCHCSTADDKTVAAALQWIIENHERYAITTVNLAPVDDQSHAEPVPSLIDEKLAELRRLGIWVSAPTGNHNHIGGISWPACQPQCYAIGAVQPGQDVVHLDRSAKVDLLVPASATSSSNAIACGAAIILREAITKANYGWKSKGSTIADAILAIMQQTGVPVDDPATQRSYPRLDLVAALDHVSENAGTASSRPFRFLYNCDADNMFIYHEPPMAPEDVHPYIDEVADAGVTTFLMSPNEGMLMNFPSRHERMLGDESDPVIRAQLEAEGREKSGTLARAALNYRALVEAGHDPLKIVIDRAREKKMEVFISFRLNEVHCVEAPDTYPNLLIISDFWRKHPEWRVGKFGDPLSGLHQEIMGPRTSPIVGTWFSGGLDFAVPEVRQHVLDQLRECCERYDIDGLDLDFQRFPIFFRYGEEGEHLATMTAWIRAVRAMTREIGESRGRPILLSARILARPEQNLGIGLDPVTWAREGLLDFVTVSHYLRNDFPLPVQEYRRLFPESVPLYASIEVEPEADTSRNLASQIMKDGADGVMMFNYFTCRESGREPDFKVLKELGESTRN